MVPPSPWLSLYTLIDAKGDRALSDYARSYIARVECYCSEGATWCFFSLSDEGQAEHITDLYTLEGNSDD